jgi:hypothetical protein
VKQRYLPVNGGLKVELALPAGLRDVCLALPRDRYLAPETGITDEDEDYYYVCTQGNPDKTEFFAPGR